MSLRVKMNDVAEEVRTAFIAARVAGDPSMFSTITRAATGAVRQASVELKSIGRSNIASAGFSVKWQNAWRVNVYPKSGYSLEAAAFGYHKIPYATIFESGGTIRAQRGLLWIALRNAPKIGRERVTPRALAQRGVKLFSLRRPGKTPLLATRLRVTGGAPTGKLSLAKLRRGVSGKRGAVRAVPLFFGVTSVTLRKRFNISGVADTVRARLPEMYLAQLET
ncbi:hypothetical protein JQ608_06645 [Bradyrhizobium liaoningense]|uniref:DUF6441 family protein n=1 Tax=Bradyrhizobium liaoningense TaxID=43992 RepID=UPI001BAC4F5E|nr:DUF6441 family protein [Bradyrhizobium liaoningense]MBR0876879.1 hypothetical protein [Bradyrhizobium liaoningense]